MVKDKQFYRQILALSLPAAFQSALSLLVVMADNVMVTRTGAYALSAVAQSNAITTFVTAGLNGLATGAVVLISQYWGKRDMKRIKTICSVAAAACLLFAVLCVIAVRLFPRFLLRLVINAGETQVINLAMQYLPIVAFSYLPYALTAAMVGMLKGVEVVRVTLYAALLSLISNVIFNYILIFGHLGLPAMGVTGAAIATVLGAHCGMRGRVDLPFPRTACAAAAPARAAALPGLGMARLCPLRPAGGGGRRAVGAGMPAQIRHSGPDGQAAH